jgi:glycosyltransferase involved in cell wall biosynthesis
MYPLDRGMWGPIVRISHLRTALAELVDLDVVSGYRSARRLALARYAVSGRLRGIDGIYVENSSNLPSETDLAFLALARSLGVPVLTYVRDAQYLFEEYYVADSMKRRVARAAFPAAMNALRAVSTRVAYPSRGLAAAVGDRSAEPLLLPPGSPAPFGVERNPNASALLFVGGMRHHVHGLDLLVDAIERVRAAGHDPSVISVSRPGEEPTAPRPDWLRVEHGDEATIRAVLPEILATIQPRRCSPYNEIAVPIKVMEYLAYERPLIVTDCLEQAAIVREADAGLVVADSVDGLADGIRAVLEAPPSQLERWSANARAAARANAWSERARQIVATIEALR